MVKPSIVLDDHHTFETGRPLAVCGNTAAVLEQTRFAPHFEVLGNRSVHYGLFPCADVNKDKESAAEASCC